MDRQRPDALFMVTDAFTNLNRRLVLDFAEKRRIPAMYEYGSLVRDGGLIAYGPSLEDMFQRAAIFIDKMLKGVEVSDLPVEEPTKFYLLINLRPLRHSASPSRSRCCCARRGDSVARRDVRFWPLSDRR